MVHQARQIRGLLLAAPDRHLKRVGGQVNATILMSLIGQPLGYEGRVSRPV
jgi:hypothetical protein